MGAGYCLFNNGVVVAVSMGSGYGLSNNGVVVAGLWVQGMVSLTTMLLLQVYRFRVRSL